ncbi:hypothetical protein psal_cds_1241 [Pandoravirus salinus]|uniref:Uncharacterized protein n=1 Tax=Pandoravirus salinus TaxID=1349410 RepID=S4W4D5_9VIRU|nr:hypothetical protein psal_cds_1241 [Pandoravirus salinus]AGO85567.1 hypothetical protein psal_cds_1241 [Pandoravirus salinus]
MDHEGDYEMKSLDGTDDFQVPSDGPTTTPPQRSSCRWRCTRQRCLINVCCALGVAAVVALSLLTAAVVFVPWFVVDIRPDMRLEESMQATTCLVTNHTVIDTKSTDGNTRLLYMPGLVVIVSLDTREAVATARVHRSDSWMSADVMGDYFARHPVNATSACYTDGERVAMQPGVDNIGGRLGLCISMEVLAFFAGLVLWPVAICFLCFCADAALS